MHMEGRSRRVGARRCITQRGHSRHRTEYCSRADTTGVGVATQVTTCVATTNTSTSTTNGSAVTSISTTGTGTSISAVTSGGNSAAIRRLLLMRWPLKWWQ